MSLFRNLMMQQKPKLWLDANRTDSAEMAASDRTAIAVFKKAGLCKHDEYMTEAEAADVIFLPYFWNSAAQNYLIDWDWSKLTNLKNTSLRSCFRGCKLLNFSNLDNPIFSRKIDLSYLFYDSGAPVFSRRVLPQGFAKMATDIKWMFQMSAIKLDYLNEDFGENHPSADYLFDGCGNVGLKALPSNFIPSSINGIFRFCTLQLTEFPKDFGTLGSVSACCWGTKFGSDTLYVGEEFGKNSKNWIGSFRGTNIKTFTGTFSFASVVKTDANLGLWDTFYQTPVTSIRFTPNTLKSSINLLTIKLHNIDKPSLLSFADCLYNFGEPSGQTWTVATSKNMTIIETEMYDETRTYKQYCEDKGWEVTV